MWPAILRHLGRGHGRSPDHRPHGGCSAFVGGGESHERCEPASSMELRFGRQSACSSKHGCRLTHLPPGLAGLGLRERLESGKDWFGGRGFRGDGLRRHGLRGNEVFMCGLPHAARRRARSPVASALRTAAPRIRRMCGKQRPPPMSQSGQFTARNRHQGTIVSTVRQLVEHVEPLPYRLPEDLAQNLVHLYNSTFPCSVCRPSGLRPGGAARYSRVPRTSVPISRHTQFGKWRPNKVGRARGWIKQAMGCAALIGHAMTVSGTY